MPVWTCPHKVRILTSTMMRNTNLGPALDAFVHPQKHCRTFFLVCVCVHGSVVTHGGTRSQPHTSSCRRHMIEGPYKFGCSPKQGKTTPVVCIFKRPLLCLFFFLYCLPSQQHLSSASWHRLNLSFLGNSGSWSAAECHHSGRLCTDSGSQMWENMGQQ